MQPSPQGDARPCRRIRVLVVDVHPAVRHAVATSVSSYHDLELAGQAASGEEALRLCDCSRPDVVLMAITLPSAADTTRTILERWPGSQVIAMSTFQEEELVPEMLRAGAVSYLLKNVSAEELVRSVRQAFAM